MSKTFHRKTRETFDDGGRKVCAHCRGEMPRYSWKSFCSNRPPIVFAPRSVTVTMLRFPPAENVTCRVAPFKSERG